MFTDGSASRPYQKSLGRSDTAVVAVRISTFIQQLFTFEKTYLPTRRRDGDGSFS